ncbi:MAG: glucose-6-phosphate dehydrogenase, partial [Proteobacteria bacterium]|nr:glucose-6-phosphate dehydrogenase [Pseudomonadota bacterium]
DLTKRLLYPALCNLGSEGLLDPHFSIVGVARRKLSTEAFQEQLGLDINQFVKSESAKAFGKQLIKQVHYLSGNFDDPSTYQELKKKLTELEASGTSQNCLFYFAVPPELIISITTGLHHAKLLEESPNNSFRRIIIEKPFGHDLVSAKKLNQQLLQLVKEEQIFRIDHYLGKETVQNLLALRFSNRIFEPVWNGRYIDHIQITVAETLGVELRGNFYEQAGALRDMFSSHLLQLLSLISMEPPVSFTSEYIQSEKSKSLHAVRIYTPEQVLQQAVRGQYGPGRINGSSVLAYRSEPNVDPNSKVETFAALKLMLDNWRWFNVPFYLRTGKRMHTRSSEIIIQFKAEPANLFTHGSKQIMPNLLRINIQPNEGISLRFNAKVPGRSLRLGQVNMDFKYSDYFGTEPQTGYETILYDCMNGDHTLFEHAEMVETAWSILQPVLDVWSALPAREFPNYAAGTWGPAAAENLLKVDGRQWLM